MGFVWRAEQLASRAPVAVKLTASQLTHAALERERQVRVAAGAKPGGSVVLEHGFDTGTRMPFRRDGSVGDGGCRLRDSYSLTDPNSVVIVHGDFERDKSSRLPTGVTVS
jgi:hypothetical protein